MIGILKLNNLTSIDTVLDVLFYMDGFLDVTTEKLQEELNEICLHTPSVVVNDLDEFTKELCIDDYVFIIHPVMNENNIALGSLLDRNVCGILCGSIILSSNVKCSISIYDEDDIFERKVQVEGIIVEKGDNHFIRLSLDI